MKTFLIILALLILILRSSFAYEDSWGKVQPLFDGHSRRNVATLNRDIICLQDGQPVAYIVQDYLLAASIYGVNGRHLGWIDPFEAIWNHSRECLGGLEHCAYVQPYKGPIKKAFCKSKGIIKAKREPSPPMPLLFWGPEMGSKSMSLVEFLMEGLK